MTVKTDDKKRIVLPTAKPGDVFKVELSPGGSILLTKLAPAQSKLVRARKVNGIVMGSAEVELDPESIVASIRADRESR